MIADAQARAAVEAELSLGRKNSDWERELALDILTDFIEEIDVHLSGGYTSQLRDPKRRLAWALKLMESQVGTAGHEERLVEMAWEKIRTDALQLEWEMMGL